MNEADCYLQHMTSRYFWSMRGGWPPSPPMP